MAPWLGRDRQPHPDELLQFRFALAWSAFMGRGRV